MVQPNVPYLSGVSVLSSRRARPSSPARTVERPRATGCRRPLPQRRRDLGCPPAHTPITWTAERPSTATRADLQRDSTARTANNWVPVGTAITATQLAVNAAELAGGTAARGGVLATDGVNTSSAESDAAFTVGRKGPSAFILAPEGEVRFMPGTPLWLQGSGYDLEDGAVGRSWRCGGVPIADGDLGTGSQAWAVLSPGRAHGNAHG